MGPSRLSTSSQAILGLLSIAPMSGYDLFQAVERSVGRFWPISKSQVYAELARLEPLGLIDGVDVQQERLPDKRVFQLTESGEAALDEWMASGHVADVQFRVPLMLKVFFGHRRRPADTAALLEEIQSQSRLEAERYRQFLGLLGDVPDAAYSQMVVLFGLRMAEAFAAWADEAATFLPASCLLITSLAVS